MPLGKTAAKVHALQRKIEQIGHERRYKTLCKVLDTICAEAANNLSVYHPPSARRDAVIQARSRALLHLYLKAKFGVIDFNSREWFVTDGPSDGGIDAYYIDNRTKQIHNSPIEVSGQRGEFFVERHHPLRSSKNGCRPHT